MKRGKMFWIARDKAHGGYTIADKYKLRLNADGYFYRRQDAPTDIPDLEELDRCFQEYGPKLKPGQQSRAWIVVE